MAVESSTPFFSPSFSEALHFSLSALKQSQVSLKPEQRMAIQAVYEGNDVFVLLPTGFGKSLCYQTLPFVMDYKLRLVGTEKSSAVLVISPLVALMVDQVQSLRGRGVKSSSLPSWSEQLYGSVGLDYGSTQAANFRRHRSRINNSTCVVPCVIALNPAHPIVIQRHVTSYSVTQSL